MNSLHLAHSEYDDAVDATRGRKTPEHIRQSLEHPEPELTDADRKETEEDITRQTAGGTTLRLYEGGADEHEETAEAIEESADHLEDAVGDLEEATTGSPDAASEKLEGNAIGRANLKKQGSQVVDLKKTRRQDRVVDKAMVGGVLRHEHEHTLQDQQDVAGIKFENGTVRVLEEVDQDSKAPGVVTAKGFTESGAIIAQTEAEPESFDTLDPAYKAWLTLTTSMGVNRKRIQELARKKDGLRTFAEEAQMAQAI